MEKPKRHQGHQQTAGELDERSMALKFTGRCHFFFTSLQTDTEKLGPLLPTGLHQHSEITLKQFNNNTSSSWDKIIIADLSLVR